MKKHHEALSKSFPKVAVFLRRTFTNVIFNGPSQSVIELFASNPFTIVCTHRSHLDYMILGMELHKAGFINLRAAAGNNLTELPFLGKKFKSWGAFSVNRSKAFNKRYITTLAEMVLTMLNDGDKVLVFPEGGRSYKGNMLDLKGGLIAANLIGQHRSPEKNYYYLPIAISYEHHPDLPFFSLIEKGRTLIKNAKNSFEKLIGTFYYYGADILAYILFLLAPRMYKTYGNVYIDVGDPFSVNEIVNLEETYSPSVRSEVLAHKKGIKIVEQVIYKKLFELYRILPVHIVATILNENHQISTSQIEESVTTVLNRCYTENRNMQSLKELDSKEIIDQGFSCLKQYNAIIINDKKITIKKKDIITYYAATLLKK